MSQAITAARPYAQAAFEEAQKIGELKAWSEMINAAASAIGNAELQSVIRSPKVKLEQLSSLMVTLSADKASQMAKNFIKILVENDRLLVLPEIYALFEALRAEAEKSLDVVVTSAYDLTDAQKQKVSASLKAKMGREIKLTCETSPELLGGIIIRAGDKVIDGSARTRLSELAAALA
jgi:F-type H+-transporting ATPase subunit delta